MRKALSAVVMLAIGSMSLVGVSPVHAGGSDISITADQLAAHGPWALKNISYGGKVYEAAVTFTASEGNIQSISIDWGPDYPADIADLILFDGENLRFSYPQKQDCGDGFRTLRYELELEEDDGSIYFEGVVTGPKSKCRGGTFEDESSLRPKTEIAADLN